MLLAICMRWWVLRIYSCLHCIVLYVIKVVDALVNAKNYLEARNLY